LDIPHVIVTALVIVAIPIAGFLFGIRHMRRQAAGLKKELDSAGEPIVLGPEVGFYQGSLGGIVSLKTQGVVALTNRRIVFRQPLGKDIEFRLPQIHGVSENAWFQGNYRGGRSFVILTLGDGTQSALMVKDHDLWMQEIRGRLTSTL